MQTLNYNFLTLQACMRETICAQGNNNYKIPHGGKAKLLARGLLPHVLAADNEAVECGFQQLDESDVSAKFDQLAVEVSEAMEMSEFSSQLEKLIVNDELKEDADAIRWAANTQALASHSRLAKTIDARLETVIRQVCTHLRVSQSI
ncbi:hypothetical protein H257_09731 [Aphanomyces astaci]|uniref:Uncharacterized protein n=1 Tax=Aphanomyces astaci TaxID=112090 RepID=W4GAB6_APHAT|nr:hypothetical protein H257_09731 [Aphanomyces astaci]ETV76236.1 hypothetical protein H257_09731 [Aphanomyces astaci]|eukprot:XP_009834361.1 hypothetical protein H257_09731 [Aphanomyces astaci]